MAEAHRNRDRFATSNRAVPSPATRRRTTLLKELVADKVFYSRAQAHREIVDYIERIYNRQRRHTKLGYLSPAAFEEQAA